MLSSRGSSQHRELNPGLPHCWWILYCLSYQGSSENTGVGSLFLLQGNFPTQESNWSLLQECVMCYFNSLFTNPPTPEDNSFFRRCATGFFPLFQRRISFSTSSLEHFFPVCEGSFKAELGIILHNRKASTELVPFDLLGFQKTLGLSCH